MQKPNTPEQQRQPYPKYPHFVFFDLESTGLSTANDEPVEIAAYSLSRCSTFVERIRPSIPIPVQASRVHHIYDADVKDCRFFRVVWLAFMQWCRTILTPNETLVLVAHNGFRFDFPMVRSMLEKNDLAIPAIWLMDTMELIQTVPHLQSHFVFGSRSLDKIHMKLTGSPIKCAHSALGDILGMVPLWTYIVEKEIQNTSKIVETRQEVQMNNLASFMNQHMSFFRHAR